MIKIFKIHGRLYNINVRDTSDEWVVKDVATMYFRDVIKLKPNPTIVDFGAHIGGFSLIASDVFKPRRIISVEPLPENIEILRDNLKNIPEAEIIPKTISITSGTSNLYEMSSRQAYSNLKKKNRKNFITVPTLGFQEFMETIDFIDYFKIDIEGMEWPILQCLNKYQAEKIGYIVCEVHLYEGHNLLKWPGTEDILYKNLLSNLNQLGFEILFDPKPWNSRFFIAKNRTY